MYVFLVSPYSLLHHGVIILSYYNSMITLTIALNIVNCIKYVLMHKL